MIYHNFSLVVSNRYITFSLVVSNRYITFSLVLSNRYITFPRASSVLFCNSLVFLGVLGNAPDVEPGGGGEQGNCDDHGDEEPIGWGHQECGGL